MKFNFISKKLKNRKFNLQNVKRKISLALASVTLLGVITGCAPQSTHDAENYNSSTTVSQEQIDELQRQIDELNNATNAISAYTANDTFTQEDWNAFAAESKDVLSGKINNADNEGIMSALVVLNIDYLNQNSKQVLIDHYSQGQDVEAEVYNLYAVLSQVREYNTELTNADDYLSYTSIIKDENDKAILSVLDGYAKEVITLKQNPTDANLNRIREIFDIIDAFSKGTGTIKVTINGTEADIAQINLSHGGIFAAENVAQDISVLCKDIVSQEKREDLDNTLTARNTVSKTQQLICQYLGITSVYAPTVNEEEQEKIVAFYNYQLGVVSQELAVMGVTSEEANALLTITNIEYFMDSANSQCAFNVLYKDGFSVDGTFKQAEEAIRKIQEYNTKTSTVYDMARLVMTSKTDAMVLRTYAQELAGVNSTDASVVQEAVRFTKDFNQYSDDAKIVYDEVDDTGKTVTHSIDKNGLTTGAKQILNMYTYATVVNHMDAYGTTADAILPLVDGSEFGLDPYESIVLMVEDYCQKNNIIVYDYNMGGNTK